MLQEPHNDPSPPATSRTVRFAMPSEDPPAGITQEKEHLEEVPGAPESGAEVHLELVNGPETAVGNEVKTVGPELSSDSGHVMAGSDVVMES